MGKDNIQDQTIPENPDIEKVDRRQFIKNTGIAGGVAGLGALFAGRKDLSAETAKKTAVKTHDRMPIEVSADYKQMDQRKTVFTRARLEPAMMKHGRKFFGPKTPTDKPGWTQIDIALADAGWSVHNAFSSKSAAGVPNTDAYAWEGPVNSLKYKFKDKKDAAQIIKRAAKLFGASLVGVAPYESRWVYDPIFDMTKNKTYTDKDFPFKPKSVIVMAIEMEYSNFTTAPALIASAGASTIYSQMAVSGYQVATFIRQLGYKAFGAGNDVALSIPFAVSAGLGEMGRNGLLVTYEYGPRVRLCKVFTELELEIDKPKTFGVVDFCKSCKRCAEQCPSKAIPMDDEPTFEGKTISNNKGVKKWFIDPEKCFKFWGENLGDCGTCISSCPYNKPDFWHHKMITAMTSLPGSSLHATMTQMDKMFGYGNTYDEKAIKNWWKND